MKISNPLLGLIVFGLKVVLVLALAALAAILLRTLREPDPPTPPVGHVPPVITISIHNGLPYEERLAVYGLMTQRVSEVAGKSS